MTVYLDSTHRNASAVYKIVNKSQELKATVDANVSSEISGTPEEYLSVSENLYSDEDCTTPLTADTKLAPGEVAYLKVEVSLTKLPVEDISNASFTITVEASPADSNDL